jgi:hypothetical protein
METIRNRSRKQMPMVLLTLLSVVQALALEWLWSHMSARDGLYEFSLAATSAWLQIAAAQIGIIFIWLIYSTIVMRFRWVPRTADSIFPFLVGIIQFFMIENMGPGHFGQWFLLLALIFAAMTLGTHNIMRRARLDGGNDAFFKTVSPAKLKDFSRSIVVVAGFAVVGAYLWVSGNEGWFATLALFIATCVLGFQTLESARNWDKSMQKDQPQ